MNDIFIYLFILVYIVEAHGRASTLKWIRCSRQEQDANKAAKHAKQDAKGTGAKAKKEQKEKNHQQQS